MTVAVVLGPSASDVLSMYIKSCCITQTTQCVQCVRAHMYVCAHVCKLPRFDTNPTLRRARESFLMCRCLSSSDACVHVSMHIHD